MNAPVQLGMFASTSPSSSPIGLHVILPQPCQCGEFIAVVGSSRGPHHASVICSRCEIHRGWVSGETDRFITTVIDKIGRPTEPITVSSNSRKSADTTATATERLTSCTSTSSTHQNFYAPQISMGGRSVSPSRGSSAKISAASEKSCSRSRTTRSR
jgi:hypothetical protein